MDQGRHICGKKSVSERVWTRTLTVLNIHSFILALVLYRVMRLEPFLGHMQDTPWTDGQSITHIHTPLQSPGHLCWCVSGLWEKPTSTQTQHSNTAPHYTRLMTVFVVVVIIASECIFLLYLTFYMYFCVFFFLQVNVDVLFLVYKRNRVEMLRLTLILCAVIQSVK